MAQLSESDIADIKARLMSGEFQHVIAAKYCVNQGRISEINRGARGTHVSPKRKEISSA